MTRRFVTLAASVAAFAVLVAARPAPTTGHPGVPLAAPTCSRTAIATPAAASEGPHNSGMDLHIAGLEHPVGLADLENGEGIAVAEDSASGNGHVAFVRPSSPIQWWTAAIVETVEVGSQPTFISHDAQADRFFVSNAGSCSVSVVGPVGDKHEVVGTVSFATSPGATAWDYLTQRLFVALPGEDRVAVLDDTLATVVSIPVPGGPSMLVYEDVGDRVFVLAGGRNGEPGSLTAINPSADVPAVVGTLPMDDPTWVVPDSASLDLFVIENGRHQLTTVSTPEDGSLVRQYAAPLDPAFDSANPSRGTQAMIIPDLLGSQWSRKLLVALEGSDHLSVFQLDRNGTDNVEPVPAGTIPGFANTVGLLQIGGAYQGFFAIGRDGVLTSLTYNAPFPGTAAAAPTPAAPTPAAPAAITYALPSPLEISLAPQDVARSLGFMALIMLLLGAPTPIFNSTLSANQGLIERWFKQRRPGFLRRKRKAAGADGRTMSGAIQTFGRSWPGLFAYLMLAVLLYCFLDPGFPGSSGARTFAVTLCGIFVGTAVSQIPGEFYVRRRYGVRGQVRVAFWTMGLAAGCVLATRLTGMQPGYVYGIIGGFAFAATLTREDSGRMAFRGMALLLAVGAGAWFLRIPFHPGSGIVGGEAGGAVNDILANLFIAAVEAAAIGLIPLRFLSGGSLWDWSRRRWALLWGVGLFLFAHVILFPVSSYEPNPSAVGLATIAITAAVYGGMAMAVWLYFARLRSRHERTRLAVGRSPAA